MAEHPTKQTAKSIKDHIMPKNVRKSLHGAMAYLTDDEILVGRGGIGAGGHNKPLTVLPGSHDHTAIWEDFYAGTGTDLADTGTAGQHFITRDSVDTGTVMGLTAATNGVFRITPSTISATPTVAGTTVGFVGPQLAWKVNQGKGPNSGSLRMVARIKKSTYSGGEHGLFVGFTDTTAAEIPVFDTGGTSDMANATNAFGIGWNIGGDTGWVGYGVDGDTLQHALLGATAPTDNVYVTLEMEAHRGAGDTGGTVKFWIDGVPKGSIDNPCNVSTALTPCVYIYDTGGASVLDVDYINVSAPRDSGT